MLKLKFKDQRRPALWLVETVTTIGSDPKSHVAITEQGIEPLHAEILKEGEALYLKDAGTSAGTYVNGAQVRQKFQLRPGDLVTVAGVELEIIDAKDDTSTATKPALAKSNWSILGLSGDLKGKSIPIQSAMVFGRSSNCDIVINDAHMSRRHAEISLSNGILRLVDLQSSNGTSVNNQKIGERVLRPGDKIQFDHVRFLVVGPLNAEIPEEDAEDEDEETLFRAAPIPRAPTQPRRPVEVSSPLSASKAAEASINKSQPTSWLPLVISGVVLVLAFVAGVGVIMMG